MIKRKRELVKLAQKEGLQNVAVIETRGNHYRIEATHLGKPVKVVTSYSPSDWRTSQNLRGYLRRAMLAVESSVVPLRTKPG